MKNLAKKLFPVLMGIFLFSISPSVRANTPLTPVCTCEDFHTYLSGISEPMYSISGSVINGGFNLTNFCPEGNGSDIVTFTWSVNGTVLQTSNGVPVSQATTSFIHDVVYGGTYEVCLLIRYSYTVQGNPEPIVCTKELCFIAEIDAPPYEPCEATADFNGVVSGNAINLIDQSSTGGQGKIISRKWTVDGYYNQKEYTYYGGNFRHVVSSDYPNAQAYIEVCQEIMVINEFTGECCTDTKCESFWVNTTSEDCSMDPDFSYSCFVDDCIFQFNGNSGTSTRNVKSWYWDFGDGSSSTDQRPIHMYDSPGTYEVCLTIVGYDEFGDDCCHETYCRTIDFDCVGVDLSTASNCDNTQGPGGPEPEFRKTDQNMENGALDNELTIAPNPTKETANITLQLKEKASNVSMVLLNMRGQTEKVYFENAAFDKGTRTIKIDCGRLAKGAYILQMRSNKLLKTQRIIIE